MDKEKYQKQAENDKEPTMKSNGLGFYQCFCHDYSNYEEIKNKDSSSLCYEYQVDKYKALALNNLVTVLVSIINIILRTLNMKLIDNVGIDT